MEMVKKHPLPDSYLDPFERHPVQIALSGDLQLAILDGRHASDDGFSGIMRDDHRVRPGVAAKNDLPFPIRDDCKIATGANVVAGL